jgi:hypothetical protein
MAGIRLVGLRRARCHRDTVTLRLRPSACYHHSLYLCAGPVLWTSWSSRWWEGESRVRRTFDVVLGMVDLFSCIGADQREDTMMMPPEELDTQVPDKQGGVGFQLFTSLLPATRGWFANHSLQRL